LNYHVITILPVDSRPGLGQTGLTYPGRHVWISASDLQAKGNTVLANAVDGLQGSGDSIDRPVAVSPQAAVRRAGKKSGVRELWAAWKRVARKIGDFQARVLLTIFYFVLLAPFALIVRRTSDPLALKPGTPRGWAERQSAPQYTLEMARKQF